MINVTKSFFPPINEYVIQLERVWENEWLTNRGQLVIELEKKLIDYLKVDNILLTTNGTLPIQFAISTFAGVGDEIITTPFSYIATSATILWEKCVPVFVDIDPEYLTIDEEKIENQISEKTKAILATHVFGNPCNVEKIEKIAEKHGIKVIYDAAHCFGVRYKNKSIFSFGDISTCSFHATKLFHTGEGGAIFCNGRDTSLPKKIFYKHNFGHLNESDYYGLGINGKMSELQAAMGLTVLKYIDEIIETRKFITSYYNSNLNFKLFKKIKIRDNTDWNYSYYPLIFTSETNLLAAISILNKNQIFPRRYFYPSLNNIPFINSKQSMPISESISSCILCLPLYHTLNQSELMKIIDILNSIS